MRAIQRFVIESNVNSKIFKTKINRLIMQSKWAVYGFVKEQGTKGLWSNLGIKIPLNNIPLLSDILF